MKSKKCFKQKVRQWVTLIIVFLLIYPVTLAAKKKGAYLMVETEDGQVIEGELLTVKQDYLLVMTSASYNGVTIEVKKIDKIRVRKKSGVGKGALKGFLSGAVVGGLLGGMWGSQLKSEGVGVRGGALAGGIFLGGIFALFGGIGGAVNPKGYKTIQVKGKLPSEIKRIMKKLKKKARFKNG